MKTVIAGSNEMTGVMPARGGGIRDWQRWTSYAAVAWSLIYAALGVYWVVSRRGSPYTPETMSDGMRTAAWAVRTGCGLDRGDDGRDSCGGDGSGDATNLISKIHLPTAIFPIAVVGSSVVHFFFSLAPLVIIVIFSGTTLSHYIFLLPIAISLIILFSVGISLTIATLTVFFHDVLYIYDVLLVAWMYLSAIFYPISILPEKFRLLMSFNPLYHYISLFRACIYDTTLPLMEHLLFGTAFAVISFAVGWIIYNKNRDKIIFYI